MERRAQRRRRRAETNQVTFDFLAAHTWRDRDTRVALAVGRQRRSNARTDLLMEFPLGGFLNLSGLKQYSLWGPHYGIGRLLVLPQDRPRRSGLLRRADLPRHVGRGGQRVAEHERCQVHQPAQGCERVPRARYSSRARCTWAAASTITAISRSTCSSVEPSEGASEPAAFGQILDLVEDAAKACRRRGSTGAGGSSPRGRRPAHREWSTSGCGATRGRGSCGTGPPAAG